MKKKITLITVVAVVLICSIIGYKYISYKIRYDKAKREMQYLYNISSSEEYEGDLITYDEVPYGKGNNIFIADGAYLSVSDVKDTFSMMVYALNGCNKIDQTMDGKLFTISNTISNTPDECIFYVDVDNNIGMVSNHITNERSANRIVKAIKSMETVGKNTNKCVFNDLAYIRSALLEIQHGSSGQLISICDAIDKNDKELVSELIYEYPSSVYSDKNMMPQLYNTYTPVAELSSITGTFSNLSIKMDLGDAGLSFNSGEDDSTIDISNSSKIPGVVCTADTLFLSALNSCNRWLRNIVTLEDAPIIVLLGEKYDIVLSLDESTSTGIIFSTWRTELLPVVNSLKSVQVESGYSIEDCPYTLKEMADTFIRIQCGKLKVDEVKESIKTGNFDFMEAH